MSSIRSIDELFEGVVPSPVTDRQADGATSNPPVAAATGGSLLLLGVYSLAIFLSAFLLFQVQPLIGKFLLPWFGGTLGVWTTCLLFFQVVLFGGYLYADLTTRRLSPKSQAIVHGLLLAGACSALPIVPSGFWKPTGQEEPISRIVIVLAATIGLPFFVLSTTGPLLQAWFSRTHPGRSPYRLYALSNVGSLLALVSFPAIFEWSFAARTLAHLWSFAFGVFAVLCAACAAGVARVRPPVAVATQTRDGMGRIDGTAPAPGLGAKVVWFLLAMVPSVLLLATTNQVCLDVASVPFLWVLPLTLYLLSFILCFNSDRWYSRRVVMPAAALAIAACCPMFSAGTLVVVVQSGCYFLTLFLCSLFCHGELARRKPDVRFLTSFYLLISAGGAAGGIFVAVVAPLVFKNYYELHAGLFACAALMLVVLDTDPQSRLFHFRPRIVWLALIALLGTLAVALVADVRRQGKDVLFVARNFYGVLRVRQVEEAETATGASPPARVLLNGRIVHGYEYLDPKMRPLPTSYYAADSGVGLLLKQPARAGQGPEQGQGQGRARGRRVGLVGLGIGTLAAYAGPGDYFRFYEINPLVEPLARRYFHYLEDCRGTTEVIPGDARLVLDREPPQNFDVLVLDAFSSDAIPIHLLTVEAFAVYLRHLAPGGVIAVHISNIHFALRPVVEATAEAHQLVTATITTVAQGGSVWILASRGSEALSAAPIRKAKSRPTKRRVLWTDEHASLFEVWIDDIDFSSSIKPKTVGGGGWIDAASSRMKDDPNPRSRHGD